MKKVLMGAAVLGLLATASCSKQQSSEEDDQFQVSAELSDSISQVYGTMVGNYVLSDYLNFDEEHRTQQYKEDMLRGITNVFSSDRSDAELMGMQVGMKMLMELKRFEEQGVKIDRKALLLNFSRAFAADSISQESLYNTSAVFQSLNHQLEELAEAKREAEENKDPQAIANLNAGRAFLANLKKNDASLKVLESGVCIKVAEEGDATSEINENSTVTLNYKGTLIDGTVFDSSADHEEAASFSPKGVIKGFGEALTNLHKGSKATIYIPAELAYGVKGVPGVIGPNQALIFEIEILDVTNPK